MITFDEEAIYVMQTDARKSYPDECCGFLFGHEVQGSRAIETALSIDNASTSNRRKRFEISPVDYMKAENYALEEDVSLLGVYHSHPDHPAFPSEHDRGAAQPFFSYVILSVSADDVKDTRSWVLDDNDQFQEETIIQAKSNKS